MKKVKLAGEWLEVPDTPLLRVGKEGGLFVCDADGKEVLNCTGTANYKHRSIFAAVVRCEWSLIARTRLTKKARQHARNQLVCWLRVFEFSARHTQ